MTSPIEYYAEKYANPDFAPGVKEKGLKKLEKKNPALAAAARKKMEGAKKASVDQAKADFLVGKVAAKAFWNELEKISSEKAAEAEKEASGFNAFMDRLKNL